MAEDILKEVKTSQAPEAVGPYSQAIEMNNLIFISGQIAINPMTGEFDESADIQKQTKLILNNIQAILQKAKSDFGKVIKTEIFLTDINDFSVVNEIYSQFFTNNPRPARQTVEVSKLPLNSKIEISCIAKK